MEGDRRRGKQREGGWVAEKEEAGDDGKGHGKGRMEVNEEGEADKGYVTGQE